MSVFLQYSHGRLYLRGPVAFGCVEYLEQYQSAVWFGPPRPTKGLVSRFLVKDSALAAACCSLTTVL